MFRILFISTIILFIQVSQLYATDSLPDRRIFIANIAIKGNTKTKEVVILRELNFKKGDSINVNDLDILLKKAKEQIINTSLFLQVSIVSVQQNESVIVIDITLRERWYIFPAPVFSLADQNFNVWWQQHMGSLDRVSYGLAFTYRNLTGFNDRLTFGFQTGYTHSWSLSYLRPNIGKTQRHATGFQIRYGKNREVNYASMFDRKSFIKSNDFIRTYREARVFYGYRSNIYTRHYFSLGVVDEQVSDTVIKLNNDYLGSGRNRIKYPEFIYRFSYINTNNLQYPLTGKSFTAELFRGGFTKNSHINITQLKLNTAVFFKVFNKTYFNVQLGGRILLPRDQPFIRFRALGYNDNELLRGLDQYVLDGNAYALVQTNLKRKLFSDTVTLKFLPKQFRKLPLQFFVKGIFDAGYIHNHQPGNNELVNRWLFTHGLGIDVISYYDVSLSFEYSFNQWMERGFFMRIKFGL